MINMSFLRKLFGSGSSESKITKFTSEEFFQTEDIKTLLKKYGKETTLLRPHKADNKIEWTESKFGGIPNLESFSEYPKCDSCDSSLNFVFQIYKKDFPEFYFPNESNIFQLFRCPNDDCSDTYNEFYDHKMVHYFSNTKCLVNNDLKKPKNNLKNFETEISDSYLKPNKIIDFPNFDDFDENDFLNIENKFGEEFSEEFMDKYSAIANSKILGYPSYTQSTCYPKCSCGKTKEFLFQLSSDDTEDGVEYPPDRNSWSSHGIMIGDVGNIYYYVCKDCGEKSIESNWDCY